MIFKTECEEFEDTKRGNQNP